jgi:uncharacterized protein YnzC (UPF0291/DUF896 family)
MEEITIRFEIVRLAVKMADHETISVQANKLRDLSLDEDLNEIISLLESRNYRQGLYLMKGYMSSLDDSFFDTVPAPTPPPKPKKPEPQPESQNLFDMMQHKPTQTINLDDMLRMTEESASETVSYQEKKTLPESYISHTQQEVQKNAAYLNVHKNRIENKTILDHSKMVNEPTEALYNPLDEQVEIIQAQEVEETPCTPKSDKPTSKIERTIDNNIPSEHPIANKESTQESLDTHIATLSRKTPVETSIDMPMETAAETLVETLDEISTMESDTTDRPTNPIVDAYEADVQVSDKDTAQEVDTSETITEEVLTEEPNIAIEETSHQAEIPDEKIGSEEPLPIEGIEPETAPAEIVAAEEAEVKEIDIALEKPEKSVSEKNTGITKKPKKDHRHYPPISYIDQKFRNMRHQFPQVEAITDISNDVKLLLKQMATKGYTENDIKETIAEFQKKKSTGDKAEAAQLLLIAAASESRYAQLLLARELFKGEVLVADYPESFTQINRLAEHDYPEAICDLAQLYEYGYGIKKDKKTAVLLYQEAAEMGIPRAQKHVERLTSKKGLLGSLFKR